MNISQITTLINNDSLRSEIRSAYELQLQSGDKSLSRFNSAINKIIRESISDMIPKGISPSEDLNEIKSHFCRGKKWIQLDQNNENYQTAIDLAQSNDLNDLISKWEDHGFAWVRFHSASNTKANFSIHKSSSEASNIKFSMSIEEALSYMPIDGTPKSNGWESRSTPPQQQKEEEVTENVEAQNEETQSEETSYEEWEEIAQDIEIEADEEVLDI